MIKELKQKRVRDVLKLLFFGKTGADSEAVFKQGFNFNYSSDGNYGRGFYFYKSA